MKNLIIQVSGGIGNQMFQIANAYALSIKFNRTLMISDKNSTSRNTYWNSILNQFSQFLINHNIFIELKRKSSIYNWAMTRFEYKEIILNDNVENYCIEGYYQTFKYFDLDIFKPMLNLDFIQNYYNIDNNDIALHIRRTDYTANNFHKVLSLEYYKTCIYQLNSKIKINNIYVFSDDIEWCKKNLDYDNLIFVKNKNEIEELIFMSTFKHFIIANSSFSWWAAYLSNAFNVYCPKNWFINGCHLNTKDLRPDNWIVIDDNISFYKEIHTFNKNTFNVISLGSACTMVHNIHENIYKNLGPLYKQPDNATNFFDWLITDFKGILYIFENLMFKDTNFLTRDNFTDTDVQASSGKLHGGWASVYKKIEHKEQKLIFLHDVNKHICNVPSDFFKKYIRRFDRLYDKITCNKNIHFIHCFDFQWFKPYFPTIDEINLFFYCCYQINPICNIQLYFLIHPYFVKPENIELFKSYENTKNLNVFYLKDKGWKDDWKAGNLNFDEFFLHF